MSKSIGEGRPAATVREGSTVRRRDAGEGCYGEIGVGLSVGRVYLVLSFSISLLVLVALSVSEGDFVNLFI